MASYQSAGRVPNVRDLQQSMAKPATSHAQGIIRRMLRSQPSFPASARGGQQTPKSSPPGERTASAVARSCHTHRHAFDMPARSHDHDARHSSHRPAALRAAFRTSTCRSPTTRTCCDRKCCSSRLR